MPWTHWKYIHNTQMVFDDVFPSAGRYPTSVQYCPSQPNLLLAAHSSSPPPPHSKTVRQTRYSIQRLQATAKRFGTTLYTMLDSSYYTQNLAGLMQAGPYKQGFINSCTVGSSSTSLQTLIFVSKAVFSYISRRYMHISNAQSPTFKYF